jgi:hypothetical protein
MEENPTPKLRPATGNSDPETLDDIRRVVYRHKWASLEDWVRSLDELADLDDEDIDEVERLTRSDRDDIYFE